MHTTTTGSSAPVVRAFTGAWTAAGSVVGVVAGGVCVEEAASGEADGLTAIDVSRLPLNRQSRAIAHRRAALARQGTLR